MLELNNKLFDLSHLQREMGNILTSFGDIKKIEKKSLLKMLQSLFKNCIFKGKDGLMIPSGNELFVYNESK